LNNGEIFQSGMQLSIYIYIYIYILYFTYSVRYCLWDCLHWLISLIIYNMKCTSLFSCQVMDWQLQAKEKWHLHNIHLPNYTDVPIVLLWYIFEEFFLNVQLFCLTFLFTLLYIVNVAIVSQHLIQQNRTLKISSQTRCYCICAWLI
jgi:hypothetical protein